MARPASDNVTLKERLRLEIRRDTQEYLRRGGTITELETPLHAVRPVCTIGLELLLAVEP